MAVKNTMYDYKMRLFVVTNKIVLVIFFVHAFGFPSIRHA